MKGKEIFSIPNLLSLFRILLIPFFVLAYVNARLPEGYYLPATILIISGLTDCGDGFIARKFNMITDFGKVLDPLADKLTQGAVVLVLMLRIPFMAVIMLIFIIKEMSMGVISFQLFREGKKLDGALWFGKACMAVFYVLTVILVAYPNLSIWMIYSLLSIILACLLFSFTMYMKVLLKMKKNQ